MARCRLSWQVTPTIRSRPTSRRASAYEASSWPTCTPSHPRRAARSARGLLAVPARRKRETSYAIICGRGAGEPRRRPRPIDRAPAAGPRRHRRGGAGRRAGAAADRLRGGDPGALHGLRGAGAVGGEAAAFGLVADLAADVPRPHGVGPEDLERAEEPGAHPGADPLGLGAGA